MSIAAVSVKRPIATTMVYLIVITLGLISFRFLPVDLLPPIEFPQLNIRVRYGNVGPEEMELIITERIENAVAGVPNLEQVFSYSSEGDQASPCNSPKERTSTRRRTTCGPRSTACATTCPTRSSRPRSASGIRTNSPS